MAHAGRRSPGGPMGASWPRRGRDTLLGAVLLGGATLLPGVAAAQPAAAPTSCAAVASAVRLEGAHLTASAPVSAGRFTPPGATAALEVPAFCRVQGVATPSQDSAIAFEVWVPATGWNGRLEVVGNGGYAGAIGYGDMAAALARGYAVAGGDSGHKGPDGDLSFVIGHSERLADWGHRSVHAVLLAARPVLRAAAGADATHAYYFGCSTGGGQGLAEAQRYPTDFDGMVLGAPGNNRTRLNAYFLWMYAANHPHGVEVIPAAKLPMIAQAAIDGCDRQTGQKDGVFDPALCRFDPDTLLCPGGDAPACLTAPQVAALRAIYAGPFDPRTGERIFAGGNPSAEAGWAPYIDGPEPARTDFWRYWVLGNPTWRWQDFDFDRDVLYADRLVGPVINNTDPDLGAFQAHGGRIIEYQGEADPIAPVGDTLAYYEAVRVRQGSQAAMDGFYRLFLAPGLAHCHGGPGPNAFGNQGAPVTALDAGHDLMAALDRWVADGVAPTAIVAANVRDGAVTRSRPLCAFPQVARYIGQGDRLDAASWRCDPPG